MIPAAREHEDDMRVPSDPYLWQTGDGRLTAFARVDCPTADDALWAWDGAALEPWLPPQRVRLGWSVVGMGLGWWREADRDTPGAVECWMVET